MIRHEELYTAAEFCGLILLEFDGSRITEMNRKEGTTAEEMGKSRETDRTGKERKLEACLRRKAGEKLLRGRDYLE